MKMNGMLVKKFDLLIHTIGVVHLVDNKFGDLTIDKHLVWRVDQGLPKILLLKIVLLVTSARRLKKNLPNCQIKMCTTYTVIIMKKLEQTKVCTLYSASDKFPKNLAM